MSTMGTFDAFTSARLGIYAAQHGFRVTGNNISNINTEGYTRQRLNQLSFKAGAYDQYRSELDNHVGSGALVVGINQIRDPYLDVRFRNTNADVGFNDTFLAGLQHIASILDETGVGDDTNVNKKGDGRLQAQIQAVSDALRKYSKEPTKTNNDLVRNAAQTLCGILNSYATKLENFRKETEKDFTDKVTEVNEILTNIRDLNDEIRDNEIFGDNALELRDERNRQIDKLSELIHIKVVYSEESVGAGKKVEKLSIYLDNDNPDPNVHTDESLLVDGIFATQFKSPETLPMANPDYDPKNAADANDPKAFRYLVQAKDPNGNLWYTDPEDPDNPAKQVPVTPGDPIPDGLVPYVGGYTNDPDEAIQVDNDYYTIQLDKLYDELGNEWVNNITNWVERTDGQVAQKAIYESKITESKNWKDGDTFDLNGTTYTVGTDISVSNMNNAAELAKFIAGKLNENNNDYTVTAYSGVIRFTAKNAGAVGGNGPAAAPSITITNPNADITLGTPDEKQKGIDEVVPTNPAAGTTLNPDGSETIVSYREKDGAWWQVTTVRQHTFETTLDDNDLYGSLQATRELLTEAGEFTTEDIRDNVDEKGTEKRGIPYYQLSLDLFARKFAEEYNKLNDLGKYTDPVTNVEYSKFVDQDGNPIPLDQIKDGKYTFKKEVPLMKVGSDGSVSIMNEDTAEYELQEGWTLDSGTGFCVKDGHFVGTHENDPTGAGCVITDKIPVPTTDPDNIEQVYRGLLDSGFSDATITPPATAADRDKVMTLLTTALNQHGVKPADTIEIEVTIEVPKPGPLFSNRNDRDSSGDGSADDPFINAANISVSQSWSNGDVVLVPKFEILWDGDVDHSTQNTNADHMVTLIGQKLTYNPQDIVPDAVSDKLYTGSFNDMYNNICTTLGEDEKAKTVALNMHYTQLIEIDTSRDGVSGVDLNDEAMNLMQYQKAYSAACRLMTVVDEALDRLINNTAI